MDIIPYSKVIEYESGSKGFFMSLFYAIFPKIYIKVTKAKYKRYEFFVKEYNKLNNA